MARKYLFIQFVLFFITGLLSSCRNANNANISPVDIGTTGPISIDKGKIPFNVDEDVTVQITPFVDFKLDSADEALIVFPAEPLKIGGNYNVIITKDGVDHIHKIIVENKFITFI